MITALSSDSWQYIHPLRSDDDSIHITDSCSWYSIWLDIDAIATKIDSKIGYKTLCITNRYWNIIYLYEWMTCIRGNAYIKIKKIHYIDITRWYWNLEIKQWSEYYKRIEFHDNMINVDNFYEIDTISIIQKRWIYLWCHIMYDMKCQMVTSIDDESWYMSTSLQSCIPMYSPSSYRLCPSDWIYEVWYKVYVDSNIWCVDEYTYTPLVWVVEYTKDLWDIQMLWIRISWDTIIEYQSDKVTYISWENVAKKSLFPFWTNKSKWTEVKKVRERFIAPKRKFTTITTHSKETILPEFEI